MSLKCSFKKALVLIGSSSKSKFDFTWRRSTHRCQKKYGSIPEKTQSNRGAGKWSPAGREEWGHSQKDGAYLVENCPFAITSIIIITLQSFTGSSLFYMFFYSLRTGALQAVCCIQTVTVDVIIVSVVVSELLLGQNLDLHAKRWTRWRWNLVPREGELHVPSGGFVCQDAWNDPCGTLI